MMHLLPRLTVQALLIAAALRLLAADHPLAYYLAILAAAWPLIDGIWLLAQLVRDWPRLVRNYAGRHRPPRHYRPAHAAAW